MISPSQKRRGPKAVHQQAMMCDIRRRIARGELKPGDRLPAHQELVAAYGVSLVTAQRAIKRLIGEGFVRSESRRGRFVTDQPPCHRYLALAFPGRPQPDYSEGWRRAFAALLIAAEQFNQAAAQPYRWVPYFDVQPLNGDELSAGYHRLERDLHAHRVGGVFFAAPQDMFHAPLLNQREFPVAAATAPHDAQFARLPYDRMRFVRRAVDHLTGLGRRRVAWLTLSKQGADYVMTEVQRAGRDGAVTIPREWVIPVDPYHPDWLEHALRVLFENPASDRPEGLVIADDHLVEPAAEVLAAMGCAVPDDLAIVGHWNWPLAPRFELPIHLLGFDAGDLLDAAGRFISERRLGTHPTPPCTFGEFRQRGGVTAPVSACRTALAVDPSHVSNEGSWPC